MSIYRTVYTYKESDLPPGNGFDGNSENSGTK